MLPCELLKISEERNGIFTTIARLSAQRRSVRRPPFHLHRRRVFAHGLFNARHPPSSRFDAASPRQVTGENIYSLEFPFMSG
jgi:hypothetical protein